MCRTCFREHAPEEYICSACNRHFKCPTQTVAYPLGNGKVLRAHIVDGDGRYGRDNASRDACGPVIRHLVSVLYLDKPRSETA